MALRTQYQFEVTRPLPVRWKARSWRPRITRLSPRSCSKSVTNCRRSRRTLQVVSVRLHLSKPAPLRTSPTRPALEKLSFCPRFGTTTP